MWKLKNDIDIKELENFGFTVFKMLGGKYPAYWLAIRDRIDDKCKLQQFYRIAVDTRKRTFDKVRYSGGVGKYLPTNSITRKDIGDLIEAGLVEKEGNNGTSEI